MELIEFSNFGKSMATYTNIFGSPEFITIEVGAGGVSLIFVFFVNIESILSATG